MSIFGLFTVQAFYLPWTFMAVDVLLGKSIAEDILGVLAAHTYYFLTVLYPRAGGPNLIPTPELVRVGVATAFGDALLDEGDDLPASGGAHDAPNPASISSTPASASAPAISNFSEAVNATPGVCSPSRSVVSLIATRLPRRRRWKSAAGSAPVSSSVASPSLAALRS